MNLEPEKLLDNIVLPENLRKLKKEQLIQVSNELRQFIIDIVSENPGHFGASLGVVELTVALHYVFNTPYDKIIWDVGHQAYGHKILTGRRNTFHTNRKYKGVSGFPKMSESEYDAFGVGHASTSVSAALGMAIASLRKNEKDRQIVAVIGDGAMTGGMAFEALNLPDKVFNGLKDLGLTYCTPIQARTLPLSLTGRDVAGQAHLAQNLLLDLLGLRAADELLTDTRRVTQQLPAHFVEVGRDAAAL